MSAWPVVKQWIDSSSRDIATLPPERGTETLVALGVTAESTLGAIVLNTGGIHPPPFTTEGKNAGSSAPGNVPVTELWDLYPGGGLLQESGA